MFRGIREQRLLYALAVDYRRRRRSDRARGRRLTTVDRLWQGEQRRQKPYEDNHGFELNRWIIGVT